MKTIVLLKHKDYATDKGFDFIEAHGPFVNDDAALDYIARMQARFGDHYIYCLTPLAKMTFTPEENEAAADIRNAMPRREDDGKV